MPVVRQLVCCLDNPDPDGTRYPSCMGTVAPVGVCQDLMFLLSQASHVLQTEMTAALARLGISPRHYCVLKQGMAADYTQIRLAELCGLDKTTMVVTLDELERAGLAERRPSTTDR